jgi:hypothetical protein
MLHFTFRTALRLGAIVSLCLAASGCPASMTLPATDSGSTTDAGLDAARADDGGSGVDAQGADSGTATDGGGGTDGGGARDSGAASVDGGPLADWQACTQTSDCVLEINDCCGWCGTGTVADVDAVNSMRIDEHAMAVCPAPIPCPRCATGPLDPQVVAVCQSMRCTAIDLGTSASTECTVASDCEAAYGNCCGCSGTDDEVIAVSTAAGRPAIDALFCAGGSCPLDCAERTPPGWGATCDAGHCVPMMLTP